ncbi:hypothetical protein F5878DRAFT_726173 [Lentinula raphanica]|uniref:Uncharacterized protein n=1 Tax=Lentinula raphanica TaxID=153919 RepID=A0AA38P6Y7_9AGAR|nr:hypothetical protein F5878DRAFT_726173 [Lentinula raphanica]
MKTMEKLEEHLGALEEYVFLHRSRIRENLNDVWAYHTMVAASSTAIPGLGGFEISPPPLPPLKSWSEKGVEWVERHPWVACGVSHPQSESSSLVVVVLGDDTPYGLPLILTLEQKGFIVITSVSSPESIEPLEKH